MGAPLSTQMGWLVSPMHQIRNRILLLPCSRWREKLRVVRDRWLGLCFTWTVINSWDAGPAPKLQSPLLDTRPRCTQDMHSSVNSLLYSFSTVLWTPLSQERPIFRVRRHHFKGSIASHRIHCHWVLPVHQGPCIWKSSPLACGLLCTWVFCFLLCHRMYASALVYLSTCSHNTGLTIEETIGITVSWNMRLNSWT